MGTTDPKRRASDYLAGLRKRSEGKYQHIDPVEESQLLEEAFKVAMHSAQHLALKRLKCSWCKGNSPVYGGKN